MEWTSFWDLLFLPLPYADATVFIPILIFIGFGVGVVSAFLGIGGAWLVTPALNILGLPMTYAVGTDMAHIGPKGFLATFFHSRRKNVDYSLALIMSIGTVIGIELGAQTIMALERFHKEESTLRWVYIVLLSILSLVILLDRGQKKLSFHKKILALPLRPFFHFKVSDIRCSIWVPISLGMVTGFVAGFLGIGGGLLRLPALIYCMGCPVLIAVGTDLFEVMLSGFYGGFTYAMKGRVDYFAALFMFMGALAGTRLGVLAACRVEDQKIKNRFGIAVFGCLTAVLCKQLGFPFLSKIFVFSTVLFLVLSILLIFRQRTTRSEKALN